jgi:hypothetical protein
MTYATLAERKEFYQKECDVRKVKQWFEAWPQEAQIKFAVIIGRHTHVFPREYAKDASTTIMVDNYKALDDVKSYLLAFLPEGAYYDKNIYTNKTRILGQELTFDLDPENSLAPFMEP